MEVQQTSVYEEKGRTEKALALLAVITIFARKHQADPLQLAEKASEEDWQKFAALAGKTHPSGVTREMVRTALREAQAIIARGLLCISCGLNPATRMAGKGGRRGADLCDGCWGQETDHGLDGGAC